MSLNYLGLQKPSPFTPQEQTLVRAAAEHTPKPHPKNLIHTDAAGWRTRIYTFDTVDAFPTLNTTRARPLDPRGNREGVFQAELERQMKVARDRGILSSKGTRESIAGMQYSVGRRDSFSAITEFSETATFPLLKNKKFISSTLIARNSPMNGYVYWNSETQKFVAIRDAATSSINRYADTLTLARQMNSVHIDPATKRLTHEAVCYAGRPDTPEKFEELASMIFLGEKRQGRRFEINAEGVHSLRFVMNSVISTSSLVKDEYKLIVREMDALRAFNGSTITIKDEKGATYKVKVDILFFNRQMNFLNPIENTFSTSYTYTGRQTSKEFSHSSDALEQFLTPQQRQNPRDKKLLELLKTNDREDHLESVEEIFCRTLLCLRAKIPLVIHCRSSIDRTTIAAMMAFTLKAWLKNNWDIPENPLELLNNEMFKELWYSFIPNGVALSPYSREEFGLKWQAGKIQVTQNPAALRLMPARYLEDFHLGNITGKPCQILARGFIALKNFSACCKQNGTPKTLLNAFYGIIKVILVCAIAQVVGVVLFVLELLRSGVALLLSRCLPNLKKYQRVHPENLILGIRAVQAIFNTIPKKIIKPGTSMFEGEHQAPLIYGDNSKPNF